MKVKDVCHLMHNLIYKAQTDVDLVHIFMYLYYFKYI